MEKLYTYEEIKQAVTFAVIDLDFGVIETNIITSLLLSKVYSTLTELYDSRRS